jgi:hypothetical protein
VSAATLRLYEATDALEQVREWLEEHLDEIAAAGGEIPPALDELLTQAEGDFEKKVERVALFIQERLGQAKIIREEAKRLADRAAREERTAETMKRYLLVNLQRANRKKVEGKLVDVRVQANPVSVKHELTPAQLAELHAEGSLFVLEQTVYSLPSTAIQVAVKDAIEAIGKAPELGTENYAEEAALWLQALHAELGQIGVPAGVRIERGHHVRIA